MNVKGCNIGGRRRTKTAARQGDRFCHLLVTGMSPSSLSLSPTSPPKWSLPTKDTDLGRLRFFPGQIDATVSPVHFCTSFPEVFISPFYSPNYDQAEISAASCCLQKHHGVSVESPEWKTSVVTHMHALL